MEEIEDIQRRFCAKQNSPFTPVTLLSKLGFALSTYGLSPINGLRHAPAGDTNGWYLWCGEEFSSSADFFSAVPAHHIYGKYPELIGVLALAPGFRFLIAGEYVDVWYDAGLAKRVQGDAPRTGAV